ncbi:hypothetical protein CCP3SC15_1500006 [Gammaproteobacteria bacterium]
MKWLAFLLLSILAIWCARPLDAEPILPPGYSLTQYPGLPVTVLHLAPTTTEHEDVVVFLRVLGSTSQPTLVLGCVDGQLGGSGCFFIGVSKSGMTMARGK